MTCASFMAQFLTRVTSQSYPLPPAQCRSLERDTAVGNTLVLLCVAILAIFTTGCRDSREIPLQVPSSIYPAICAFYGPGTESGNQAGILVHVFEETMPIYRFEAMAPRQVLEGALQLRSDQVREFSPRTVPIPGSDSCVMIAKAGIKPTPSVDSDPASVWIGFSNPVWNPYSGDGDQLGVFARASGSRISFESFPGKFLWIPIFRSTQGDWKVGEIVELRIREM